MRRMVLVAAVGALLAACSTSKLPERFHTLVPEDSAALPVAAGAAPSAASSAASSAALAASASATAASPVYIDVLPVSIPPQVDHAQWAVRQPDGSLLLLEQDRWAAPLQDELRGAIVARLTSAWGAVDVRGVAPPQGSVWRVRVDVQRFESVPGRETRIEAAWSVLSTQRGATALVCRTVLQEAATQTSIAALAEAHRRAVTRLADEIGRRIKTASTSC
jgi:uncharacterized lipoprotein YmbA